MGSRHQRQLKNDVASSRRLLVALSFPFLVLFEIDLWGKRASRLSSADSFQDAMMPGMPRGVTLTGVCKNFTLRSSNGGVILSKSISFIRSTNGGLLAKRMIGGKIHGSGAGMLERTVVIASENALIREMNVVSIFSFIFCCRMYFSTRSSGGFILSQSREMVSNAWTIQSFEISPSGSLSSLADLSLKPGKRDSVRSRSSLPYPIIVKGEVNQCTHN